ECFDVIFCRNVMIYYDRGVRKDLTSYFHGCLKPGGYLIIGPSETLAESEVRFQYVRSSIYRKASQ
ncbi:MAG: chemotaxis protein CheR, partial [Deltaproteobacteria bacterium]